MIREFVQSFPLIAVVVTAITIFVLLLKKDRKAIFMSRFPGPPSYPIIGSVLELNISNEEMAKLQFKHMKLYGPRYVIKLGSTYYMCLGNGEDIEKLLGSSVHIHKGHVYDLLKPWLGEGLLVSNGQKWQARRKLLTPTFHFKILEDFMPIFNEQSNVLVEILRREFIGGQVRDMCPYITRCALDVICETAMGKKLNSQKERDTPYVKAVYKMCGFVQYRSFRPWLRWEFLWRLTSKGRKELNCLKILHEFTDRVIEERKRESLSLHLQVTEGDKNKNDGQNEKKQRLAFLDLLIEAQKNPENNLKNSDLREEVDTFMFEGHDTTAASINWTLFLLGAYKEHQAKVHSELDEIFGSDRSRSVTTQDLARMKYLDLCIKESLRLYPSVPFLSRSLKSDCVLDDGHVIPEGINVFVIAMQTHRNPKVYPNPELFSPERFLPENSVGRHPFSYIPFSAGPRNCIGQKFASMEEKVVIANFLRNFTIEATQKQEDVVFMNEVITRPRDGLPVKFFPR